MNGFIEPAANDGLGAARSGQVDVAVGGGMTVIRLEGRSGGLERVRRAAAHELAGGPWESLSDDVQLVVSELTTNALLHGVAPVEVRVITGAAAVRVEVADASRIVPVRPPVGGEGLTGRGMALVAAASSRWGVDPTPTGKIVWAEFRGEGDTGPAGSVEAGESDAVAPEIRGLSGIRGLTMPNPPTLSTMPSLASSSVPAQATVPVPGLPLSSPGHLVRLGDVPTDLLLAAKNHVDGLVREFTLAVGGAASGASSAVPERLGELLTTVTTRFSGPRQAIKRQALAASAAGHPRTPLELVLPPSAADDAERYLAALEEIEDYARAARLLTVESPPQHVAFRRWYIGSLVEQLHAAERGRGTVLARSFEQYLLDTLDVVVGAQRTAERAARLQRVTAALARATTPEQVAATVVVEGAAVLAAAGGVLLIPHGAGRMAVPGSVGYGESMVAALRAERLTDRLPAADALRTGEPVWLESRRERDSRYPDLAELEPTAVAMCVLPLFSGERTLGALRFSFDHPRLFDDDERSFVQALAAQTGLALERARLFLVERAARERTTLFAAATDLFTSTLDTSRILEHLVGLLVPWHAMRASACRVDDEGGVQVVAAADRADLNTAPPARAAAADHGALGLPGLGPVGLGQPDVDPRGLGLDGPGAAGGGGAPTGPSSGLDSLPAQGGEVRQTVPIRRLVPDRHGMTQALRTGRPARSPDGTRLALPLVLGGRPVAAVSLVAAEGRVYADDDHRVIAELVDRATVAIGNARQYEQERGTAVTLQRSLLPQQLPQVPGLSVAWRYLPANAGALVGGDWYDVLPVDDARVALVIGDVMGHGIHAAAAMGQLRATVRAHLIDQASPGAVLTLLDAAACRLEQSRTATAAVAVYDPADGRLVVASAGHLPPLLIPARGPARYVPVEPGPPLSAGLPEYPETELTVEPGSTLLLYTDGLVEDRARPFDEGMDQLRACVTAGSNPDEICDQALAALGRSAGHEDDTALLAVRFSAPPR
ncbi:SpoIIE family protein phosphatase [Frankia sp. AgKG'84/4]|uniref:SpoIIE family protein phosphatase n=1 Tax=Frankia sp. AgKG'84/4 TaxID=573490 RepID=UPI00200C14BF|nr:SpoIIE family protein phosphatase [Frankia sp. AgKG'84/4]MCL9796245.1 SpoIIE family protein phosphatase [Frankia sp. AgKG'84/4]